MTLEEFDTYFEEMVAEERELLQKKGQEYSGKEDRHANFTRLAAQLKLAPEKILWVYLTKHMDGILSYINGDYAGSEPIRGRIEDARNYLALLAGMIESKK
jgi:hypothetical protein